MLKILFYILSIGCIIIGMGAIAMFVFKLRLDRYKKSDFTIICLILLFGGIISFAIESWSILIGTIVL